MDACIRRDGAGFEYGYLLPSFDQEGRLKSVFVSAEFGELIGLAELKSKF